MSSNTQFLVCTMVFFSVLGIVIAWAAQNEGKRWKRLAMHLCAVALAGFAIRWAMELVSWERALFRGMSFDQAEAAMLSVSLIAGAILHITFSQVRRVSLVRASRRG